MAYHLTILRSAKGKQLPISPDEARAAANGLPGWSVTESPPCLQCSGEQGTFTMWFSEGELWTHAGEQWQIAPMIALAERLDARVRGDEFETYQSPDKTFAHPDDRALRKLAVAQSKALLAKELALQKRIRYAIIGFFAILGVVGYSIGKWFERP